MNGTIDGTAYPFEMRTTQATCDLKWVSGELQQRYVITVYSDGKIVNGWSEWHLVPSEEKKQ